MRARGRGTRKECTAAQLCAKICNEVDVQRYGSGLCGEVERRTNAIGTIRAHSKARMEVGDSATLRPMSCHKRHLRDRWTNRVSRGTWKTIRQIREMELMDWAGTHTPANVPIQVCAGEQTRQDVTPLSTCVFSVPTGSDLAPLALPQQRGLARVADHVLFPSQAFLLVHHSNIGRSSSSVTVNVEPLGPESITRQSDCGRRLGLGHAGLVGGHRSPREKAVYVRSRFIRESNSRLP